jgi:putative membrane protein
MDEQPEDLGLPEERQQLRTTAGSRARDHLANERTWLAWIRTALSLIVLGLAIARFAPDRAGRSEASGVMLVSLGLIAILIGTWRYRTVNRELEKGYYLTGSRGRAAVVGAAFLLAVLVLAVALLL